MEEEATAIISHFNTQYHIHGFTETERVEVVKAIGHTKGHWFKCPNGHFYCIGECGGATETEFVLNATWKLEDKTISY